MLKKLTIHKFRSCENTTIEFDQPLSALCGKNGVGKTTILRAVEWIARAATVPTWSIWPPRVVDEPVQVELEASLDDMLFSYAVNYVPSKFSAGGLAEKYSIHRESGETSLLYERSDGTIRIPASNRTLRIGESMLAPIALMALLPDGDSLLGQMRSLFSFFRGIRYYPLDDGEEDHIFITESIYDKWKIEYEVEGDTADSVNLRLIHLWKENQPLLNEILHLVGSNGLGLIDEFDVVEPAPPASAGGLAGNLPPEARYFVPVYRVAGSMGGTGKSLGFHDLSDGTRRILRLVVSLLFDDCSVMMLEQPEDAIHPGLLHKVIDLLKTYSDRTQVLMATHSPTVLDALEPENILLVSAPHGVTQVQKLSADELESARVPSRKRLALRVSGADGR